MCRTDKQAQYLVAAPQACFAKRNRDGSRRAIWRRKQSKERWQDAP
jgi:hypothetical protein